MLDWRIHSIFQLFDAAIHQGRAGTEDTSCSEIRLGVCGYRHGDDHDENVHEDSGIGKPAKLLQCSDLAKHHTNDDENDYTNDVAEFEFGYDRKSQSIRDGDK